MLFDFNVLGDVLKDAKRGSVRRNPSTPVEYKAILDRISQWAKASTAKSQVKIVAGNSKLNAKVYDPTGSNRKHASAGKSIKWEIWGVALMPGNTLRKFFHPVINGKRVWLEDRLKAFNVTKAQVERFGEACPGRTAACTKVCLTQSGQMSQDQVTSAQVRRHLSFLLDNEAFMTTLIVGIAKKYVKARKKGANLGMRLNVTSDVSWEEVPVKIDPWLSKYLAGIGVKAKNGRPIAPGRYPNIMAALPQVLFYDYTKVESRIVAFHRSKSWPKNYVLVWSLAETPKNRLMAIKVLVSKKTTVSAPFDVKARKIGYTSKKVNGRTVRAGEGYKRPLPETLTIIDNTKARSRSITVPVLDADIHDMRVLDEPGSIAGLRFKQPTTKGEHFDFEGRLKQAGRFVVRTGGSRHPSIKVRE